MASFHVREVNLTPQRSVSRCWRFQRTLATMNGIEDAKSDQQEEKRIGRNSAQRRRSMEPSEYFYVALFVICATMSSILWFYWQHYRCEEILKSWAEDYGYEILSKERSWVWKGPFFFWTSEGQAVFLVTVRTKDGRVRNGWVRCGGWFLGIWRNQAEARWDDE